jgi:hypothetical protein
MADLNWKLLTRKRASSTQGVRSDFLGHNANAVRWQGVLWSMVS